MKALWRFIKGVLKVAGFALITIVGFYIASDWSSETKIFVWITIVGLGLAYDLSSIKERLDTLALKLDMLESSLDDRRFP